ncbi:hypothetical protein BABINDRAFT_138977 [Babjeviella inositovora NRRL Y-12698]|uniref:Zn(2)-C6 fungal-type domain-containing protein n=1 Tax=Babjeviella inositovora NRRL Y-12698 TaxID=984486 RepID=A0A1E3QQV9_9ASCO|nr:uncharacterized protein BABINDRAFT_138977 [Babjeviella inositovora NRRL Y-12698]ODQ80040.1 hypothetical protein BABINDRAFT_138977 [Babjeviella inositovora NRRL Y-12698]
MNHVPPINADGHHMSIFKNTRRRHRKSRNGCKQCKTARVKCDERIPRCGLCSKKDTHCSYLDLTRDELEILQRSKVYKIDSDRQMDPLGQTIASLFMKPTPSDYMNEPPSLPYSVYQGRSPTGHPGLDYFTPNVPFNHFQSSIGTLGYRMAPQQFLQPQRPSAQCQPSSELSSSSLSANAYGMGPPPQHPQVYVQYAQPQYAAPPLGTQYLESPGHSASTPSTLPNHSTGSSYSSSATPQYPARSDLSFSVVLSSHLSQYPARSDLSFSAVLSTPLSLYQFGTPGLTANDPGSITSVLYTSASSNSREGDSNSASGSSTSRHSSHNIRLRIKHSLKSKYHRTKPQLHGFPPQEALDGGYVAETSGQDCGSPPPAIPLSQQPQFSSSAPEKDNVAGLTYLLNNEKDSVGEGYNARVLSKSELFCVDTAVLGPDSDEARGSQLKFLLN